MNRTAITATLFALLLVLAPVAPAAAAAGATGEAAGATGEAAGVTGEAAGATGGAAGASTGIAAHESCSFPVTATDATGTEVTVGERPERVVTLSPSAAQTMWEIGGKSQVVGVTEYAAYLNGTDSLANVSGAGRTYVDVEATVNASPDLVLAPNVIPNATVAKLREADLTVYKFDSASSIEDIYAKTELTGELTGNCEGAAETVSWMQGRIATVREAVSGADEPAVFLSQGGGWTAGEGTFLNTLVEVAGGQNIALAANDSGYFELSEEVVVQENPAWIVQVGQFGVYPETAAFNSTTAVQNDQVLTVRSSYASQPAPRVIYPIVAMAKAFHPDAWAAANATETTSEMTSETDADDATTTDQGNNLGAPASETTTQQGATSDSTSGVPGFGVGAAVVALVGAMLLGRRE